MIYCREGLQGCELGIRGAETVTECTGITVPWGGTGQVSDKLNLLLVYRPPSQADQGNTERLCGVLRVLEGDYNLPGVDWKRNWSDRDNEMLVAGNQYG